MVCVVTQHVKVVITEINLNGMEIGILKYDVFVDVQIMEEINEVSLQV
jgi:hypothetical protein